MTRTSANVDLVLVLEKSMSGLESAAVGAEYTHKQRIDLVATLAVMEECQNTAAKNVLSNACEHLRSTSGRTATEGPRRILTEASKCVGTPHHVDLNQPNIARRVQV